MQHTSEASNYTEDKIQSETVLYFHNNHHETRYCIWAVANGGFRDAREANKLMATGVVSGIQDVHVLWNGKLYVIEFKDEKGIVTPPQKACHAMHARQGVFTYIIRDHKDGINLIYSIIKNKSLERFEKFISPYAVSEMYEQYEAEAIAYKAKLKAQRKARLQKAKTQKENSII
jgi:hypothetical protein